MNHIYQSSYSHTDTYIASPIQLIVRSRSVPEQDLQKFGGDTQNIFFVKHTNKLNRPDT